MNGMYYEPNKILVLYKDDEYALSWLIDLVNKNNNIKHINTVYECGYYNIIICLNDNSTITMLKCDDIESTYNYLRGHRYDRIYMDSSIESTYYERGFLESLVVPRMPITIV
jgi:hypothetical protein